jgi:glutamate dehydrogenase
MATASAVHMRPLPINKMLESVSASPDRMPSPQPTNLGGASHTPPHRVIHETGSGYIAPKFDGKAEQMEK